MNKGAKRLASYAVRLPDKWLHNGTASPSARDGERTVRDDGVRRCLQVEPSRLREVRGRGAASSDGDAFYWRGLEDALRDASSELTPGAELEASLDKVLVYRPGDFFLEHRDSKKAPRHVMTMAVVCRTEDMCSGGGVVHFSRPSDGAAEFLGRVPGSYACWFNGERHGVTPVVGGHRVVLQYTVSVVGAISPPPAMPGPCPQVGRSSALSVLEGGVIARVVEFLPFADQRNLSETCRGMRCLNDPRDLYKKLAVELAPAVRQELARRKVRSMGFFLRHEYSLDGNRTVDPLQIRGGDAVVLAALTEAFPGCRLSVKKAIMLNAIDDDDSIDSSNHPLDPGEVHEQLFDTQVCHDVTRGEPYAEEGADNGGPHYVAKPEIRHLLPEGKTKLSSDVLWSRLQDPTDIEDDTEEPDLWYWPFFRTLFVWRRSDGARIRGGGTVGFEDHQRWGNAAMFRIYWYTSVAFILTLEGTEQIQSDVVDLEDEMQLVVVDDVVGADEG